MAKRKQELVLLDTRCEIPYECYLDFCELNECEPQGDDSEDYWSYVSTQRQWDLEDFIESIKGDSDYWIITGSVGLWSGRRDIYQTMVYGFEDAIKKCLGREDYIKVIKKGSVVEVNTYHHDGSNCFELRALTAIGLDRFERRGEISIKNRENIKKLPEYLF
jgi:hypothetical protein